MFCRLHTQLLYDSRSVGKAKFGFCFLVAFSLFVHLEVLCCSFPILKPSIKKAVFRSELKTLLMRLKTEIAKDSLMTAAVVDPWEIFVPVSIKGTAIRLFGKLKNR